MAAEMESLVGDLLTKCYYHQTRYPAAQAVSTDVSYAPPASVQLEEPLA